MPERRGGAGDAGIADQNVDLAVTLMQRRAEPGDAFEVGEIERHQRGAAAVLADLVVEFFKAALGARDGDDMRAGFRQRACRGVADAARGAGNQRDTGGEGWGHAGVCFRHAGREPETVFTAAVAGIIHVFAAGFTDADGRDKPGRNEKSGRHETGSRQLASASNDNCRGCGSVWVWSVRWVG